MDHSLKCVCLILVFISVFCGISVSSAPRNSNDNALDTTSPHQNQWYGPRIQKNKNDHKISEILESLEEYPWALIAVNENLDVEKRGGTHNFTPRLGRTVDDIHTPEDMADITDRPGFFSPRLGRGRNSNPYSHRLGRDDSFTYA